MLGDGDKLELVLTGLVGPFPEVREFAALALGQIGGPRALEALRARFDTRARGSFSGVGAWPSWIPKTRARASVAAARRPRPEVARECA